MVIFFSVLFFFIYICTLYICREFQIGVDISRGRGRYRDTNIVTFVAHYQLENRTQYKLAFLQRHQLKEEVGVGSWLEWKNSLAL